jgi:hypothetical protein
LLIRGTADQVGPSPIGALTEEVALTAAAGGWQIGQVPEEILGHPPVGDLPASTLHPGTCCLQGRRVGIIGVRTLGFLVYIGLFLLPKSLETDQRRRI